MVIHDVFTVDAYGDDIKVTYVKRLGGGGEGARVTAPEEADEDGRFRQSKARAKARVFELAACNEWQFFVTLTLDGEKRDRFDLDGTVKDLAQFVRNRNRKRSEGERIRYLLVPEQHKNGAWHLHGLFAGLREGVDLVPNEHGYLDWAAYRSRFGFFSCSRIRDKMRCARYISKYVTKSFEVASVAAGHHLFFASQGLRSKERLVDKEADLDLCPVVDAWDFENDYVKVRWFRGGTK